MIIGMQLHSDHSQWHLRFDVIWLSIALIRRTTGVLYIDISRPPRDSDRGPFRRMWKGVKQIHLWPRRNRCVPS